MALHWLVSPYFLSAVATVLALYYFFVQKVKKFKNAGIPYLTPVPLLGNSASFFLRMGTVQNIVDDVYYLSPDAKYVVYFDLSGPVIMIRDLDLIKSITVKNFEHFPNRTGFVGDTAEPLLAKNLGSLKDDRWKHVRNILTPAFTSSKMKTMFNLILDCAEDFTDALTVTCADGTVMNTKDVFTRYTNDVIATCAFGISVNSMKHRDNEFFTIGKESNFFEGKAMYKLLINGLFPKLSQKLGLTILNKRVEDFFKDIIQTTMKVRDEKGIYRPDLIQLLMETRGKLGEGKELSAEDMTAQAFVFYFAGFESTSVCMCFLAHEIAVNPDVYARLREEVDQTMEETGGKLTYEAVSKMAYLDAVLNEVLRLYPLAPMLDRQCGKTFELPPALPGAKPYVLEKGQTIWIPTISMHRDPKFFKRPDRFDPDRFLDKEKNLANHPAYTPFGLGPRMCIGNRFALLEIKILFSLLISKCSLNVCHKTVVPMKFSKTGFGLAPEGGFWLNISKRDR